MRILALCGSLRARSANRSMLEAAREVAPAGVDVVIYERLAELPHFNPDLDDEGAVPPPAVAELRGEVACAGALLVSSPEYAHGVPGALKNALDWLVSSVDFPGIPVGLVNASLGAHHAHDSLVETLRTMSADVVPAATVRIALLDRTREAAGIVADPLMGTALRAAVEALVDAARRSGRVTEG